MGNGDPFLIISTGSPRRAPFHRLSPQLCYTSRPVFLQLPELCRGPTIPSQLPEAFLDLMRQTLPDEESLQAFLAISQQPLRRSLRVNTLKISVADFASDGPLRLAPDADSPVRRRLLD